MSEDNVVELGAHKPSVESVISRLVRFQDKIKHISVTVEWNDESADVFGDTKPCEKWLHAASIMRIYSESFIKDTSLDEDW